MQPGLAALVIHDLKNALGALEAELDELQHEPGRALARQAHRRCAGMRQQFMMFLTLYGADGELRASCDDESPGGFVASLVARVEPDDESALVVRAGECRAAPPFWYFDHRLVRMAMDAALHNAMRFARREVVVDAREDDGHLVLSIDDDGPGLGAPDDCASSTGLGTELCDAVARAHRTAQRAGFVRLFDRPEGGARFELWLA